MKRALWAVLLLAVLAGAAWAAYSRDITGALRKDAATLTEAVLKAIEYIIDNGVTINAGTNKTPTVVTQAVDAAGTGEALVDTATYARKVYLNARKAAGANTGIVYIGTSAVDKTNNQQIALAPGDAIVIDPGLGCTVDLHEIYVDAATKDDGVTGWYIPK